MLQSEVRSTRPWKEPVRSATNPRLEREDQGEKTRNVLQIALKWMDEGQLALANRILTAALMDAPSQGKIWLLAGICRLRMGAMEGAGSALKMAVWLDDSEEARSLLEYCTL